MGHQWSTHITILCSQRNIKWELDSRRSEIYSVYLRLAVLENIAFTHRLSSTGDSNDRNEEISKYSAWGYRCLV